MTSSRPSADTWKFRICSICLVLSDWGHVNVVVLWTKSHQSFWRKRIFTVFRGLSWGRRCSSWHCLSADKDYAASSEMKNQELENKMTFKIAVSINSYIKCSLKMQENKKEYVYQKLFYPLYCNGYLLLWCEIESGAYCYFWHVIGQSNRYLLPRVRQLLWASLPNNDKWYL